MANDTDILPEEQTATDYSGMIMVGGILILLLVALFGWKMMSSKKEKRQRVEKVEEKLRKLVDTIKNMPSDPEYRLKIKRIDVYDLPEEIQLELKDKKLPFNKLFNQDKKQPYIMILKEDNTIEIKARATVGEFKHKDAKKKEYATTILTSDKLHTWDRGDKMIRMWVVSERHAEALPHKEGHLAKSMYEIIKAIQLNAGNLLPKGKGLPVRTIIIIGLILMVLGGLYYWWSNRTPTVQEVQGAVTLINQTAQESIKTINIG